MGGQFYGYVTGTANLSCEAEAEPPPSFRWLDAENNPVVAGTVVNMQYKVKYSTVPSSTCYAVQGAAQYSTILSM